MHDSATTTDYLTIGRYRDDDDFDVFATLNNSKFGIAPKTLARLANELRGAVEGVILVRQDAPDVVSPEGDPGIEPGADL